MFSLPLHFKQEDIAGIDIMDANSDEEGGGLELVHVSDILDYLGECELECELVLKLVYIRRSNMYICEFTRIKIIPSYLIVQVYQIPRCAPQLDTTYYIPANLWPGLVLPTYISG